MVVIKYKKVEEGIFFSHLNMLRLWNRLISIAGVNVKYTEGFNKTRRLYFSSPTRVGVSSLCEYIVIDSQEEVNKVVEKLKHQLPPWLEILSAYNVEKKFNIASLNSQAKYGIYFDGYKSKKSQIDEFFKSREIIIPVISHGNKKMVNVRDRIYEVFIDDKRLEIKCGVGNSGVRIDEVVKILLKELKFPDSSWEIVKEELYLTNDTGEIEEVDEFLKKLNREDS